MINDPNQPPPPPAWLDFNRDPNLNGSLPQMPPPDRNFIPNDLPPTMRPAWMRPTMDGNIIGPQNAGPPAPYGLPSDPGPLAPGNSQIGSGPGRLGAGQLNRPNTFTPNLAGPYTSAHPMPTVARPGEDNIDSMGTGYAAQTVPGSGDGYGRSMGYAPNQPQGPQPMPTAPNSQTIQYSNGPDQQGMRKYLQPDAPLGQPQQMPRLQMPVGMPPQGQDGTPTQNMVDPRAVAMQQALQQMSPEEREAVRQQLIARMRQNEARQNPAFTPYSNQRAFAPYGDNQR